MIGEVLSFLRNHLNTHLNVRSGLRPGENAEEAKDKVVFIEGEKMDPITFELGAISVLLINVEEEKTLRSPDPYTALSADGTQQKVQPDIRLNLYVLFVARFKEYEQGLNYLSRIIQHFQNHRIFDNQNAPELKENIERLIVELITLPFSEQNELWNSLRTTYHPSVLYKVKMVVLKDEEAPTMAKIKEIDVKEVDLKIS
jgi:hypothetical protein